jgi:WD40 repeat protein
MSQTKKKTDWYLSLAARPNYKLTPKLGPSECLMLVALGETHCVVVGAVSDGQNSSNWARTLPLRGAQKPVQLCDDVTLFCTSAPLHPDGQLVALPLNSGGVALTNITTGKATLLPENDVFQNAAFSPDGAHVAAGSSSGNLCVWSMKSKKVVGRDKPTSGYQISGVAWHPEGKWIATGAESGVLAFWSVERLLAAGDKGGAKPDFELEANDMPYELRFSPDGKWLATGLANHDVVVFDLQTKRLRFTLEKHQEESLTVAFHPTLPHLVSGSPDGRVCVWSMLDGELLLTLEPEGRDPEDEEGRDPEDEDDEYYEEDVLPPSAVSSVDFSPDGSMFAVARARKISVWQW